MATELRDLIEIGLAIILQREENVKKDIVLL